MVKIYYVYVVKAYHQNLYISQNESILLTENVDYAKFYQASIALKVAKNAEKLFGVKFCIEMVCKVLH